MTPWDCFSAAPLNGAELRCSKPDRTAARFACPGGPAGQLRPGPDLGRGDTPVTMDRNTRNLGCDNVRFCVRLQRRQRRAATMQQGLRRRACKRPRDQLRGIEAIVIGGGPTVFAQRQLSIRVTVGRGGRAKAKNVLMG